MSPATKFVPTPVTVVFAALADMVPVPAVDAMANVIYSALRVILCTAVLTVTVLMPASVRV
jgi:hypothetical protein